MAVLVYRHLCPDGLDLIQGKRQMKTLFKINGCLCETHSLDDPLQIIRDPAANPDEASQIEEMENMIESLKHIIESYKERIAEQTSRHEKEIERMTAAHTDRINSLTKDKIALAIVTGFLILFIVFLFSYDILNPSVGWFQR